MATLSEEDKANLVAYLDGELDDDETQALEARLGQDPAARAELESLKQVYGLLDYLPRPEPSDSFTHRTMERLSLIQKPRKTGRIPVSRGLRWRAAAAWLAGIAFFFGAGWYSARFIRGERREGNSQPAKVIPANPDRDWLLSQPKAIRAKAEALKDKERDAYLDEIKIRERKAKDEWLIASRFWGDLQKGVSLPAQLSDFPDNVETYVKEYLRYFVTKEELARLEQAQGQWPLYPLTLVELADKHPPALLGPNGHRRFEELPLAVQKLFKAKVPGGKGLKTVEGNWPGFAKAISQIAETRGIYLPNELWPSSYKGLNPEMKDFVDKLMRDVLTDEQKHELQNKTPHRWPEYPQAIQDLARAHGLEPPWFVLPGSRETWDRYRIKK